MSLGGLAKAMCKVNHGFTRLCEVIAAISSSMHAVNISNVWE